jgi:hypothetical protein
VHVRRFREAPIRRLLSRGKTSPFHNFCQFSRCGLLCIPRSRLVVADRIPVFLRVVSVVWTPHQAPSRIKASDVSLPRQTSAPGTVGAPENRQFPTMSNRLLRTDALAPLRVPFLSGSRQRRRQTPQLDRGPSGRRGGQDDSDGMVVNHFSNPSPTLPPVATPQPNALCTSKGTRSRMM